MMIPGVTGAQRIPHLNRINNEYSRPLNLKTFLEFADYEPPVHHSIARLIQKAKAVVIHVTPGTLSNVLTATQKDTITSLQLTGQIDARDFKTMRDDMPVLSDVDISSISIISYTGSLGTAGTTNFTYPANIVPQDAFVSDNHLLSIIFPATITSIADSAFYNCGLSGVLSIPNVVVSIGNSAFESCSNLTGTITLPNSVTTIGVNIFADCQSLTGLILSNSLTSISNGAFFGDWLLYGNLTIPNSVTSIGDNAFLYCYLTSVTIPNSVTSIGVGAFEKCKFLSNVILPNSITSISDYAFALCARLTSITIPSSVTSIGNYAFTMSGLTSFSIPNSVISIGNASFALTGLKSITIPTSVTSIGNDAFDCPGLSSVYANSPTPIIINDSVFRNKATCILYVPAGSKTLYQTANEWKDFGNIIEMIATGFNDARSIDQFTVYPNPFTGGFYISVGEKAANVSIYDLRGMQLQSMQVTNNTYVNMMGLPQGQYILKLSTSEGTVVQKLVKK